jgi:hypothetical protein
MGLGLSYRQAAIALLAGLGALIGFFVGAQPTASHQSTARLSPCHISKLASSTRCKSSATGTTDDSAHNRSTTASNGSTPAATATPAITSSLAPRIPAIRRGRACVAGVARAFHGDHTRFADTKARDCRANRTPQPVATQTRQPVATHTPRPVPTLTAPAGKKLINVGYGCALKNFSKKGPCWNFAVVRPGCVPGVAIIWTSLGAMMSHMKSFKAINSCHSGRIYSQANLKGRFVTCSAVCRSLGKLNDHDVSLVVGWGKTP